MSDEPTEENTPAGSYRLPGNDVSGYLGVDNEYMNYANPGEKPILTDQEAFLFLPADDEDEVVDDDFESEVNEDEARTVEDGEQPSADPELQTVTLMPESADRPSFTRPAL